MNLLQLILKQMRQRALGTTLTLLSVLLGVALAVSILLLRRGGQSLFGQTEFGYDVIAGIKSSPLQLVLNSVYHIDQSPGNVPYWVYEQLNTQERRPRGSTEFDYHKHIRTAIPLAVGDSYKGRPIIGAPPKLFVSLADLSKRVTDLTVRQQAIVNSVRDLQAKPDDEATRKLAADQDAVTAEVEALAKEIDRVGNEVVPLMLPEKQESPETSPATAPSTNAGDLLGASKKWKYGEPASLKCADALARGKQAAEALRAKNLTAALAAQEGIADLLNAVARTVAANSGPLEYRPGRTFEIAEGRVYHAWKFEAVIGSEVAEKTGLKLGSTFQATHGMPGPNDVPDIHKETWQVVGIMKPTHTAADRCLYIPLISFYCIFEHEEGLEAHDQARLGQSAAVKKHEEDEPPPFQLAWGDELCPGLEHKKEFIALDIPPAKWEVSAVMIKSRSDFMGDDLIYHLKNGGLRNTTGVNPARTMRKFFDVFLSSSATVLLLIAMLVSIVAGIGILVSIYNSVAARNREIAILRALGATRQRVLTLICAEAALIGLVGGVVGLLVGHLMGAVASAVMNRRVGQGFNWVAVGMDEILYLGIVVVIAVLAGLVPALKAYRTPVATNLVAG